MSRYTTQIRFICENALKLKEQGDYSNINDAIREGRKVLFGFDYELFDPEYKSVIETKFLRHFYTREIGQETVALFKLKLEDVWQLKLPYYNKLWESDLLQFNPLQDADYTIDHKGKGTSDRDDVGRTDGKSILDGEVNGTNSNARNENLLDKYSDTPQGDLNGILDGDWLTNARHDVNTITDNGTFKNETDNTNTFESDNTFKSNIITTDDYLRHVVGKFPGKSYSRFLKEYRDTFINIDEMFIHEFDDLFMLIY